MKLPLRVRVWDELISIGPPRIAWGDNPPWPFDEDRAHVFSTSLSDFTRLLMLAWLRRNAEDIHAIAEKPLPIDEEFRVKHPNWGDQFLSLFVPGCVALYLEARVDPQGGKILHPDGEEDTWLDDPARCHQRAGTLSARIL